MKKQTAVEWFFDKMKSHFEHDGDLFETVCMTYAISKAMEKEQHKTSFNKGYDRRNYIHDFEYGGVEYWEEEPKEFEQYYNETYGGDK